MIERREIAGHQAVTLNRQTLIDVPDDVPLPVEQNGVLLDRRVLQSGQTVVLVTADALTAHGTQQSPTREVFVNKNGRGNLDLGKRASLVVEPNTIRVDKANVPHQRMIAKQARVVDDRVDRKNTEKRRLRDEKAARRELITAKARMQSDIAAIQKAIASLIPN